MNYMLYHPFSFPQRNLLLRVVVFILEHLCFIKSSEHKFFDFFWLCGFKLVVQVLRDHFSLPLQDLRNLHFLVISGLFVFVFIKVEPKFVHFDSIALLQFLHFIFHYLIYNLSVHLRSRARHARRYQRVFKCSYHALSTLNPLEQIYLLHNPVDRNFVN